jgi:putative DNA primase/helicase
MTRPLLADVADVVSIKGRDDVLSKLPEVYRDEVEPVLREMSACVTAEKTKSVPEQSGGQGRPVAFPADLPWEHQVDGAELLDGMLAFLTKYVVFPHAAVERVVLYSLLTHCYEAFDVLPLLAIQSREKRSGKTNTLALVSALCPRPFSTSNASPASLFRLIEQFRPTLLVDEAETFISVHDELRGILNAGTTRRFAFTTRIVGENHEPRQFSTWCPKILALIGRLPSTLEDRSIVVQLERRKTTEPVERIRWDRLFAEAEPLRRKAARWASDHFESLRDADPEVPRLGNDRMEAHWRSLLAIADLAGGTWPERARRSAKAEWGRIEEAPSLHERLLRDIRKVAFKGDEKHVSSEELCGRLISLDNASWGAMKQRNAPDAPIDPPQLARLLKHFDIRPRPVRLGERTPRGYSAMAFADAFERYATLEVQHPQLDSDVMAYTCTESETSTIMLHPAPSPKLMIGNGVAPVAHAEGLLELRNATDHDVAGPHADDQAVM